MFHQRRKKYKNLVWAGVLTAIAILSLALLLGYLGSFNDRTNEERQINEVVTIPKTIEATEPVDQHSDTEKEKKQTYYLLKYDNDIVRVYFSDQMGELTELEETDIVYETLSTEDQAQFREGIKVDSRDELNKVLMDYGS